MGKAIIKNIYSLLVAFIIAMIFRTFIYEPFNIPSGSMKPNLEVGNYIFASKFHYGYSRYSIPFGFNIFEGRIFELNQPKRGDVIIFKLPLDKSTNYIKRLIGLPGDKVIVKNGIIYINGEELKQQPNGEYIDNDYNNPVAIAQYIEHMDNKEYLILDMIENSPIDNTYEYTVPEDHYFFMGDNRDNSQDSRSIQKVGYVHKDLIIGKATIKLFPEGFSNIFKLFAYIK